MNDIRKRLEEDDTYIQQLIDLIPVQNYFENTVKQKITEKKHAIADAKVKGLKRKRKLSKKGKHALARLDPHQQKSVSQIQLELDEEEKKSQKKIKKLPSASKRSTNLQELKGKLKMKAEALSGKRKNMESSLEEKRKMKKLKKKSKKMKGNTNYSKENVDSLRSTKSDAVIKPNFNKENKILYSKFNTEEPETEISRLKNTFKKPEKLLMKTMKEKKKELALEAAAPDKAQAFKEKIAWKKAIDRSKGVKVKDNPELLKQSIRKRNQEKRKSQKKWEERKSFTKKRQEKRQQKRNTNIRAKKQEKINKKIKRARKKGRIF